MNYFFCFFSSSLCFGRITCSILRLVCGHVVLRQTPTIGFHQPAKRLPSRCHSVLGIPIPNSLAFWASPSHITAAFWASLGTLPGCPNPQCFGHPSKKILDFAAKSKTFQRWIPLNTEIFSSILKRRFIRKALQSNTKRLCENLPKSSNMTQNQSPCSTWPRRRMAQRFDDLLSPRKRKRESSKSATLLLFLDMPAAIILFRKSKSDFIGLTTTRTRWKWLVTNFIYFPMHPLDRGF